MNHNHQFEEHLDYIAYMFNVRTAGKAYENFIVNAIYTKVGNPELVPVTQQFVRNPRDPRRYYLLDLYFPQLNYGIEVDEGHHLKDSQKNLDSVREEDIKTAIECDEDRISIFNSNGVKRSYDEVCGDIDKVVEKIKKRIAVVGTIKWETNEDKKEKVKKRGSFNIKDDVFYDSITEIYNICGGKRTGEAKGEDARMLQRCYYRLNDKYKLWVPILAIEDKDGIVRTSKMGYENTLSEDRTILTENSSRPMDPHLDIQYKRVVFMRMRDRFGKPCIKFIGVYELMAGSTQQTHIYTRIADEVLIADLK